MTVHTVVVGGGVAGCMAASAARSGGSSVTLVTRSLGATALSTGAVSLDGLDGFEPAEAEAALDHLESMAPLEGDRRADPRSWLLGSGAVISAHLVGPSHAGGALEDLRGRSVLVVGVNGFAAFDARHVARRLASVGIASSSTSVPVEGLRLGFDLTSFPLARGLDMESVLERYADRLADEAVRSGRDVIALPPVLGLDRSRRVAEVLDSALDRPWFELLSVPPSVPGLRFHEALHASLVERGVGVLSAEIRRVHAQGRDIVGLTAFDGETTRRLEPDQVILATGRHIGGGIVVGDAPVEATLGLHVPWDGSVGDGGRLMEVGVVADDEMRPLDEAGQPAVGNVRVCGSLVQGGSYAQGTGGIGLAAVTGWMAGTRAARSAAPRPTGKPGTIEVAARPGTEGCLGCEVCSSACPVITQATVQGTWYPGPRGVGGLGRNGPLLDAAADPLSLCTLCGACASLCPVGARNHETVASLRARLLGEHPEAAPEAHRAMPEVISQTGNVYGTRLEPLPGPRREDSQVAFFPGCALSYFERESAGRTVKLLESLDVPLSLVDGDCCGGPLDVLGLDPDPRSIERNREAVRATGASVVTASCPRCAHRLARDLDLPGVRVEHTLETLERLLPASPALERIRTRLAGRKVTYHDPCELGRYRGLYDQARRVLDMVGADLVEMERNREKSACCGAGGGLRSVNPKLSRELSRRRVEEAMGTGAEVLLTECPSCLHNLRTGRKRKQRIGVEDLTALLGEALE